MTIEHSGNYLIFMIDKKLYQIFFFGEDKHTEALITSASALASNIFIKILESIASLVSLPTTALPGTINTYLGRTTIMSTDKSISHEYIQILFARWVDISPPISIH